MDMMASTWGHVSLTYNGNMNADMQLATIVIGSHIITCKRKKRRSYCTLGCTFLQNMAHMTHHQALTNLVVSPTESMAAAMPQNSLVGGNCKARMLFLLLSRPRRERPTTARPFDTSAGCLVIVGELGGGM